jgi:hypothetical protein
MGEPQDLSRQGGSTASEKYTPATSPEELLRRWLQRLRESQFCHYEAASSLQRANYLLGIPVVVLAAIVGTSVFSSLESDPNTWMRIVLGLVSILAAVLASLQTFLGFAEKAEKHRASAARYGIARREVEELVAAGTTAGSGEGIGHIRAQIDSLALDAPAIPDHIVRRARRKMEAW